MKHARAYQIIVSQDKKMAVLLRPQVGAPDKNSAYVLYDGSDRAYLYRHKKSVVLLDYLNPQAVDILKNVAEILVIEADWDTNQTLYDYMVPVKHEKYT